ncbi:hypothetical protein MXD63_34905 [Frankia sp. Cpl3]|nr:hypothetical protein [Frankia sp. Cpl3]
MATCPFCGSTGKLTAEHVFGTWLSRIGLTREPAAHGAGPLNRIVQDLGVRPPFGQTVRVCGECNNGWMSRLEVAAQRALTPFVLGGPGEIAATDTGAVAAWVQKTALTAMLVSSEEQRRGGYGLPASEFRGLWDLRDAAMPLPASLFWIGRYTGRNRLASTWVAPLAVTADGLPQADRPQGYAMTVLVGQLVLHGVRFTTPSLQLGVTTRQELPQLWPAAGPVAWTGGAPVDDGTFLDFAGGKDLRSTEQYMQVGPWKLATELPASRSVKGMVELPVSCGNHVVYYPAGLVDETRRGRFYAFETACECPTAYLIHTERDGARCKAIGTAEYISELYEGLPGEEHVIADEHGTFSCKRLKDVLR